MLITVPGRFIFQFYPRSRTNRAIGRVRALARARTCFHLPTSLSRSLPLSLSLGTPRPGERADNFPRLSPFSCPYPRSAAQRGRYLAPQTSPRPATPPERSISARAPSHSAQEQVQPLAPGEGRRARVEERDCVAAGEKERARAKSKRKTEEESERG